MTDFIEQLKTELKNKRNIKENSMDAYFRNLKIIMKLLNIEDPKNLDFLKDSKKVLEILKGKKDSTIRNYLASIVVFLSLDEGAKKQTDEYRTLMDAYNKQYSDMVKENKKTASQEINWTSMDELKKVLNSYKKELDRNNSLKKDTLTKKEFDLLQKYVTGSLYIGDIANPPLRLDYAPMDIINRKEYSKLTEEQKRERNYLITGKQKDFSIGEYKTNKTYGTKIIPVGKQLNTILNIWLKFNNKPFLLINSKGESMTANGLTKYLMKVFEPSGKKISASMLRHIYLTEKMGPIDEAKKSLSDKMLHSTAQQSDYIKK